MTNPTDKGDVIWIVAAEQTSLVRGDTEKTISAKSLKISELADNVKQFLEHLGKVLQKTPEVLQETPDIEKSDQAGKFQLDELEVSAEISTEGKVSLLGTSFAGGATGGLRFIFRRLKD